MVVCYVVVGRLLVMFCLDVCLFVLVDCFVWWLVIVFFVVGVKGVLFCFTLVLDVCVVLCCLFRFDYAVDVGFGLLKDAVC